MTTVLQLRPAAAPVALPVALDTLRAEYLTIAGRSAQGDRGAFKARVLAHLAARGLAPSPAHCVIAAREVKFVCPACDWETHAACVRCEGRRWVDDRDAARNRGEWSRPSE